jgi:integrase
LVDELSRPRFWATVWDGILTSGKPGTVARHLASIDRFYKAAAISLGEDSLDSVITRRDFDTLEHCLTSYLAALRNEATQRSVDLSDPWTSALAFVTGVMRHLGAVEASKAAELEARLKRLEALYSQITPRRKKEAPPIRALPSIVVEEFSEIFDPNSRRNPFSSAANRYRNYLIFCLYFHLGLRRGEVLILPASAVKSDRDLRTGQEYRWINVANLEDEDPRYLPPSLKTEASQRQLPIRSELVDLVDLYVSNYRHRSRFGHLFISQKGTPLAVQTVNEIFQVATLALSDEAKRTLEARGWASFKTTSSRGQRDSEDNRVRKWVSPHDFRHTAVVLRLKRYISQGLSMDEALGKSKVFFGWSYNSAMPFHYARAYWQTDAADTAEDRFERHVDALRSLDASSSERGV